MKSHRNSICTESPGGEVKMDVYPRGMVHLKDCSGAAGGEGIQKVT